MEWPEGKVSLIIWFLCLPVYIPLYYTLPEAHSPCVFSSHRHVL